MTETLGNGYSTESTLRELSNEYQHDRVWMVFKNLCIIVRSKKVVSALEGSITTSIPISFVVTFQFSLSSYLEMLKMHCCLCVMYLFEIIRI